MSDQQTSPDPASPEIATLRVDDDLPWALKRVANMAARALVNSSRFGKKLLKGFGYPDEVFGDAQDYRALSMVLDALASTEQARQQAERERDVANEALRLIQQPHWCQRAADAEQRLTEMAQEQERLRWQPIADLPDDVKRDGTVVLRPHVIYGPMDVRWKPGVYSGKRYNWVNGDYTTSWPDEAFYPVWMSLSVLPDPAAALAPQGEQA